MGLRCMHFNLKLMFYFFYSPHYWVLASSIYLGQANETDPSPTTDRPKQLITLNSQTSVGVDSVWSRWPKNKQVETFSIIYIFF